MAEDYKADPLGFISVSVDEHSADWRKAIIKHDFSGVQLSDTTGFNSFAAMYCKALWVPTYIVADQNGRIIQYNAPQAVEPELKTVIDSLLKK